MFGLWKPGRLCQTKNLAPIDCSRRRRRDDEKPDPSNPPKMFNEFIPLLLGLTFFAVCAMVAEILLQDWREN
jgi:hypothetical protein